MVIIRVESWNVVRKPIHSSRKEISINMKNQVCIYEYTSVVEL